MSRRGGVRADRADYSDGRNEAGRNGHRTKEQLIFVNGHTLNC